MAGSGTTALATDVNNPYNTGLILMGLGGGDRGYGQTTFGTSVTTSTIISTTDYNSIRYDLLNASAHQNGTATALTLAANNPGDLITTTNATNFAAYASTVDSNRLVAHTSRVATSAQGGQSRTASWYAAVSAFVGIGFNTPDQARFFWNGGGQIKLSASRSGGDATAQNSAWSSLLSAAGVQTFGASTVYGLTTGNSTIYTASSSNPYSGNSYSIVAALNANWPSATQFYFTLSFVDNYVDPSAGNPPLPEDLVNGTLSYNLDIVYPSGGHALSPSGTWTSYFPSLINKGLILGG